VLTLLFSDLRFVCPIQRGEEDTFNLIDCTSNNIKKKPMAFLFL
jgi:hypothetical protein